MAISGDVTVWASELRSTIKSEMIMATIGAVIDETRGREGSGAPSSMAIGEIVGEAMAFTTMTGDATIGIMGVAMMCDDVRNTMGATGATIATIGGATTLATTTGDTTKAAMTGGLKQSVIGMTRFEGCGLGITVDVILCKGGVSGVYDVCDCGDLEPKRRISGTDSRFEGERFEIVSVAGAWISGMIYRPCLV